MRAEDVIKKSIKCLELCTGNYGMDTYLDNYIKDSKERAKLNSLLFYYYRNKLTIDFIIELFVKKKVKKRVYALLEVAVTQIIFQKSIRIEVVVDSAVNYAKKVFGRNTAGFVNAVLRNIERNKNTIPEKLKDAPKSVKLNIPDFVMNRWNEYYSKEEVQGIINIIKQSRFYIYYRFINQQSDNLPIYNSEVLNIDNYYSAFTFYKTQNSSEVVNSDELRKGKIYIQDPATSLSVSAVNFKSKGIILDACSAPGGKTLMLAELYPDSRIIASDRSEARLQKVNWNIKRTVFKNVELKLSDITDRQFENECFDVVFLDVPCSNSGVMRKRPDVLWKLSNEHLESIKQLQKEILESAKKLVKKGGKLAYSTCSIEYDENAGQIKQFLNQNKEFKLEFQQQLLPGEHNDGAFVSILIKV